MKDKVLGTNPPANQTTAITNEITIVVGSGPQTREVPDVKGQPFDLAKQNLTVYGFPNAIRNEVDSTEPEGEVIGTNPPAGKTVPLDTVYRAAGVAGQPVHHAGPDRPVLDRRRAAPARVGLDRCPGQGRRRAEQRTENQRGGQSEPVARDRGELQQQDHAELRVVAARTVSATSSSSCRTSASDGAVPQ